MWIERRESAELETLLAGDARWITVHALAGGGASSLVVRHLEARRSLRVDLRRIASAADLRRVLESARTDYVFLDEAHRPRFVRAVLDSFVPRASVRIIVAARAPLGSSREHVLPLRPLATDEVRQLLLAELRRLGVGAPTTLEDWIDAVDGWPPLVFAAARRLRVLGAAPPAPLSLIEGEPQLAVMLQDAQHGLPAAAQMLLVALAHARTSLVAADLEAVSGRAALTRLVDRSLIVEAAGRWRLPSFVADHLRANFRGRAKLVRDRLSARILASAEQSVAMHRRDPAGSVAALQPLLPELSALACDDRPDVAVRAVLALEPLLVGSLDRETSLALLARARAASRSGARSARLALAHARTLIARGDHEMAETLLRQSSSLRRAPWRTYAAIYLGHIEAWRGQLSEARALLDRADTELTQQSDRTDLDVEWARQDLLIQRMFIAHEAHELGECARLARVAAAYAKQAPAPRLATIARRFVAETMLRRGEAAHAAQLLEQSRQELLSYGERVGALFVASRLVEALRAAGDEARADTEARHVSLAAARSGEGMLELSVVDAGHSADGRVAEFAWRAQIPRVRAQAEAWLARRAAVATTRLLRLDPVARAATLDATTVSFARRSTLWHILLALANAHARGLALSHDALFLAAWPNQRIIGDSAKKRVQTGVWTLRRALLGDALVTTPAGYALASNVRVESMG